MNSSAAAHECCRTHYQLIGDEPEWQAWFTTFNHESILAWGHGDTVTNVTGSIRDDL
jgi:hypothetical protein